MSNRLLVVVPVDGSQATERTVECAVSIARGRAADVHVVQVVSRDGGLWTAPEKETALRARLRALRPSAAREGVRFRIVTLRGRPERVIPAYAQLNAASLIVVGCHYGSSRFWRTSTVANRLSRSSPVPVVVLPTPGPAVESVAPWALKRIVAAVDFTVASAIALRTAVDVASRHGADLTMLHVMNSPHHMVFSGGEASLLLRRLPAEARGIAQRLKKKARAFGARDVDPVVVTGVPYRGIVETAAKNAADLIVMGVAPRTSFHEAACGSTLRAVLGRVKTPVLVVPVVAGAHAWIDAMNEQDTFNVASTDTDAYVTRLAA